MQVQINTGRQRERDELVFLCRETEQVWFDRNIESTKFAFDLRNLIVVVMEYWPLSADPAHWKYLSFIQKTG